MSKPTVLVVGCGDLGERVGAILDQGEWQVHAVRRHPPAGSNALLYRAADYTEQRSLDFAQELRPQFVLATFTPAAPDIEGYQRGFAEAAKNLLAGLGQHRVERLIMVSSTRVYAENAGGWIDETAALAQDDERAGAIIQAERSLLESQQPVTVVRLAGLYGAPQGRLVAKVSGGRLSPPGPVRYTNRIHRDDAAGFAAHLLTLATRGAPLSRIYNGVDDEPAPAHEVESWLAEALGIRTPAKADVAPSIEVKGKRCSNALLRASGYRLLYPNYRAGYRQVLDLSSPTA